ncbi:putative nse4/EID Nse3/MAGE-binding protein [Septoria linicola]|nr:putative nse4/EID Nse3/MAGE-binding protein [Septoria linicola]
MARLNARPSTVAGSRATSVALSPTPDQENRDPSMDRRRDKGKGRASDASLRTSLPTPSSDGTDTSRGQKRKRTQLAVTQAEDVPEDQDPEDAKFTRYYDPNQDAEKRRQIKRKSRAMIRKLHENRDDLLKGQANGLTEAFNTANQNFKNVKQTSDATMDARYLVDLSTIAKKKAQSLVLNDTSAGLDVDQFLTRCIYFMKHRHAYGIDEDEAAMQATQRQTQTQRTRHDRDVEEDDEDDEAELEWDVLGRHSCFPFNRRPACPSFLLGPLSVQKKVRAQTQRRARQRQDAGPAKNVERIGKEDMAAADPNALTTQCNAIWAHLRRHVKRAKEAADQIEAEEGPMDTDRAAAFCKQHRVSETGSPSLFEYVINPASFGQTVENLFYVSFLIKEGNAGVVKDSNGLPTLEPLKPRSVEEQRIQKTTKNQSVFSLDYATWQQLIEAFDIKEPMIPHRNEDQPTQVTGNGWYA